MDKFQLLIFSVFVFLLVVPTIVAECGSDVETQKLDKRRAIGYKLAALASILVASIIGVCIPLLAKLIAAFDPQKDIFFMIKAFAAGVILATGFIHVLPDAFDNLTSPCLKEHPWGDFPFTGFIAMCSATGTLIVETYANTYFSKRHSNETQQVEVSGQEEHGHAHQHSRPESPELRHRIISQVLELGIIVHSVVIGVSLGASANPKTIRPLIAALSFHQFFEGLGLGSCITQANFKKLSVTMMGLFFALTTPAGIGIGIGISNIYNENSPASLVIEGIFDAASAGILIYMALVDLLAVEFQSPRMINNAKLQFLCNLSLLLGAGCMSVIAIWA